MDPFIRSFIPYGWLQSHTLSPGVTRAMGMQDPRERLGQGRWGRRALLPAGLTSSCHRSLLMVHHDPGVPPQRGAGGHAHHQSSGGGEVGGLLLQPGRPLFPQESKAELEHPLLVACHWSPPPPRPPAHEEAHERQPAASPSQQPCSEVGLPAHRGQLWAGPFLGPVSP